MRDNRWNAGVDNGATGTEVLFMGKHSGGYWGYDMGGNPVNAATMA